jgi:hypothetical protein
MQSPYSGQMPSLQSLTTKSSPKKYVDADCSPSMQTRRDHITKTNDLFGLKPSEVTIRSLTTSAKIDHIHTPEYLSCEYRQEKKKYGSTSTSDMKDARCAVSTFHNFLLNLRRLPCNSSNYNCNSVVVANLKSDQKSLKNNSSWDENSQPESVGDLYSKYESILHCLRGEASDGDLNSTVSNNTWMINLWTLREMAFTKGGYLCPSLRKRVWPILTSCHVDVMSFPLRHFQDIVSSSKAETVLLPTMHPADSKAMIAELKSKYKTTRNFSLGSSIIGLKTVLEECCQVADVDHESTSLDSVSTLSLSTSSPSFPLEDEDTVRTKCNINENVKYNWNDSEEMTLSRAEQESYSIVNRGLKRTMANVLSMVLRKTCKDDCKCSNQSSENEHELRYYDGLIDLTDLLLTNLESPSLTTLVL